MLEALGSRHVPPEFTLTENASSVFASPEGSDEEEDGESDKSDKRRWKTLRDFVDERGIEEASETMENERLDVEVRIK